eukprot:scaffold1960_cov332-Prasinococcus_capsulatus_cf.AAC.4
MGLLGAFSVCTGAALPAPAGVAPRHHSPGTGPRAPIWAPKAPSAAPCGASNGPFRRPSGERHPGRGAPSTAGRASERAVGGAFWALRKPLEAPNGPLWGLAVGAAAVSRPPPPEARPRPGARGDEESGGHSTKTHSHSSIVLLPEDRRLGPETRRRAPSHRTRWRGRREWRPGREAIASIHPSVPSSSAAAAALSAHAPGARRREGGARARAASGFHRGGFRLVAAGPSPGPHPCGLRSSARLPTRRAADLSRTAAAAAAAAAARVQDGPAGWPVSPQPTKNQIKIKKPQKP